MGARVHLVVPLCAGLFVSAISAHPAAAIIAKCGAGSPYVPEQPPTDQICIGLLPQLASDDHCPATAFVRSYLGKGRVGFPWCPERYECQYEVYLWDGGDTCHSVTVGGACVSGSPGATCACSGGAKLQPDFTCRCEPPLIEKNGECVHCADDADCDDDDFCDGKELCINGKCVPGENETCDDQRSCTVDVCNKSLNRCDNTLDELSCACKIPIAPAASVSLKHSFSTGSVSCPVVGGSIGTSAKASLTVGGQSGGCDDGCKSLLSGEGTLSADASLCTDAIAAGGSGKADLRRTQCVSCDTDTCELTCAADACVDETYSGSLSVEASRFKGYRPKFGKGMPWAFDLECGGTLSGSAVTDVSYQGVEKKSDCQPCEDCQRIASTFSASGEAKLGCNLTVAGPRFTKGSGIQAGGYLRVRGKAGAQGQAGACANQSCGLAKAEVEAGFKGKAKLQLLWYAVGGECQGQVSACSEANSCGACTCPGCRDVQSSFACQVKP